LRLQARATAPYIKIAEGLWFVALMFVMLGAVTWIVLAVMTGDYYSNAKVTRDAAAAGGGLLSQLGSIEAVKDWVLPLAFLGLATFLLGFGFAFGNIMRNVRLRANTMAATLPAIKLGQKYCETCKDIKPPHDHQAGE
jgi:hypothetical protein